MTVGRSYPYPPIAPGESYHGRFRRRCNWPLSTGCSETPGTAQPATNGLRASTRTNLSIPVSGFLLLIRTYCPALLGHFVPWPYLAVDEMRTSYSYHVVYWLHRLGMTSAS